MDMRRCLAEVARYEFDTLIQDIKAAISGLERQRGSVFQAIEAAKHVDECSSEFIVEMDLFVMGLIDNANHLDSMLKKMVREVEQMEANQFSPGTGQLISWPIWLDLVPAENCQLERKEVIESLLSPRPGPC